MVRFLMSTAHGPAFLERMNYMYPLNLKSLKGVTFGSKEVLQRKGRNNFKID